MEKDIKSFSYFQDGSVPCNGTNFLFAIDKKGLENITLQTETSFPNYTFLICKLKTLERFGLQTLYHQNP